MNFPSSYSPSKFTKLTGEPYDLDCPNPSCQGWLNVFARKGETKPCFLRCANSSKNNNGDCTVSTIFSAKESACPACHRSIKRVFSFNILTLLHVFLSYYYLIRVKFWQHSMSRAPGFMRNVLPTVQLLQRL